MDVISKVFSGLRWQGVSNLLSQGITWTITIVVMRILSPSDYGLFAMAGVVISFSTMMSELGMNAAIVQKKDLDDETTRHALGLILFVNVSAMLVIIAFAPMISSFFEDPRLTDLIRVLALQFIPASFITIPQSLMQRELNYKLQSIIDSCSAVLTSIVSVGLAVAGFGVWVLVWASFLTIVLKAAGYNALCEKRFFPRLSFSGCRELLKFGTKVTSTRLIWYFYSQSDIFIIGKVLGQNELGVYSVALNLATLPVQKLSGMINQISFPAFSRLQYEPDHVKTNFLKSIQIMSFIIFPVFWGTSAVATELVALVLGPKWVSVSLPLRIIALIMPFYMTSNVLPSILQALGRPDIALKNTLLSSVVMVCAFVIGVQHGITGVSLAWLIAYPLVFIFVMHSGKKAISFTFGEIFEVMSIPVFASLIMYILIFFLGRTDLLYSTLMKFIAMVFSGVMTYAAVTYLLDRDIFFRALKIVK